MILKNSNAEPLIKWIFRKEDKLDSLVFFFISKSNAMNARYLPLFDSTKSIRIVYFKGVGLRYSDRIIIFLYVNIIKLFKRKVNSYKIIHLFNPLFKVKNQVQILHLDDPEYSDSEIENIRLWEKYVNNIQAKSAVICTNTFTQKWLSKNLIYSDIIIIEQGFHKLETSLIKLENKNFSCVYSSPYIHYGKDKHGNHTTWGSSLLINEIIPKLFLKDPSIEIHLVGEIGKEALKKLSRYKNVKTYGRVDFLENAKILSKCDIGLYPRNFDHKRSILKIYSYLGANIPIVTFDLTDTSVVKKYNLGLSVTNVNDFVDSIIILKNSPNRYKVYVSNISVIKSRYNWAHLSNKMEKAVSKF